MGNIAMLAQEAKTIHDIFTGLFYSFVTTLLLLGIFLEYFKWPLGGVPSFAQLVGRTLIAVILLHTFTEVTNLIADTSDGLAQKVGDLNNFKLVLTKMSDKLDQMTASWVSVKESLTMAISFIGFFALYFSIYVAEGVHLFTWTLCYVFSPVLIALYVLPGTASATSALYRTLIEVSLWKVVWSVLATLLWSAALSDINQPGANANFVSVICMNLMLASSLLATPWVVHALASSGLAGFTRSLGGVAVGAATITPMKALKTGMSAAKTGASTMSNAGKRLQGGKDESEKK